VSPHGTDSSRGWDEGISAPATLMRLAAGAGREAQERTSIVHEAVNIVVEQTASSPVTTLPNWPAALKGR
jgi:hypothetical protein